MLWLVTSLSSACSTFRLNQTGLPGAGVISARTMDLAFNQAFALTFVTAGFKFYYNPDNFVTSKHAIIGVTSIFSTGSLPNPEKLITFSDGLNSAGLSCSMLVAPDVNTSVLPPWTSSLGDSPRRVLLPLACAQILAQYATVAEVVADWPSNTVFVGTPSAQPGLKAAEHAAVVDASGRMVVLEVNPATGQTMLYDDDTLVMTNAPTFPEQMGFLSSWRANPQIPPWINNSTFLQDIYVRYPTSYGTAAGAQANFAASPGDLSSPSRFVRLAVYNANAGLGPLYTTATLPNPAVPTSGFEATIPESVGQWSALYPASDKASALVTAHLVLSHVMDVPNLNDRGATKQSPGDTDLSLYWVLRDHDKRVYYYSTMRELRYQFIDLPALVARGYPAATLVTINLYSQATTVVPFGTDATGDVIAAVRAAAPIESPTTVPLIVECRGGANASVSLSTTACDAVFRAAACSASAIVVCMANGLIVACPPCGGGGGGGKASKKGLLGLLGLLGIIPLVLCLAAVAACVAARRRKTATPPIPMGSGLCAFGPVSVVGGYPTGAVQGVPSMFAPGL